MDRWTPSIVFTPSATLLALALAAPALALTGSASAQAASTAPSGAPYTPPGYSLSVPSSPERITTGTTVVTPTRQAPETQSIRELWVPGLVGLPVSYVTTWIVGSVSLTPGSSAAELAYIPILGPWLMLGEGLNGGGEEFYATMGVIQGVSLVCLVLGLAIRLPKPATDGPSVSLRPTSGGAMSATVHF